LAGALCRWHGSCDSLRHTSTAESWPPTKDSADDGRNPIPCCLARGSSNCHAAPLELNNRALGRGLKRQTACQTNHGNGDWVLDSLYIPPFPSRELPSVPLLIPQEQERNVSRKSSTMIILLLGASNAAKILGRSPTTLKRWRQEGIGPNWIELEGRVSYDIGALLDYIQRNTRVASVRAAMEETRETV